MSVPKQKIRIPRIKKQVGPALLIENILPVCMWAWVAYKYSEGLLASPPI